MKPSLVLGLDAGSANVVAVLTEVWETESQIIAAAISPHAGVRRGMVVDLNLTSDAMREAIASCAEMARRNLSLAKTVLSVAGPHVASVVGRAEVLVQDPTSGVSQSDVELALNSAALVSLPEGRQIIHVLPRAYRLDSADGIVNPQGLAGRTLSAEAHLVTVEALPVQNYLRAAAKAGVTVIDYQLGLYATGEAVLQKEERENGCLLLDFGAGMTGLAIYDYGRIWHVGMIPIGGEHITRDLATVLQVPLSVAERLKKERGWASVDQCPDTSLEMVSSTGQKAREMQDKRLAQIIEARVQEILRLASEQVKESGYAGIFPGGLVLTGGGARLRGLVEYAGNWFGLSAHMGIPEGALVGGPEFATAVGLCQWGAAVVRAEPERDTDGASLSDSDMEPQRELDKGTQAEQDKRSGGKNWLGGLFG